MNLQFVFILTMLISSFEHMLGSNPDLVVSRTGIDYKSPSSVGIVFFMKINNTSNENDYEVRVTPDVCCLKEETDDCNVLQIVGGCSCFIPNGASKTVKLVAPILDPCDRIGYCIVFLDSKSTDQRNNRNVIQINFNTSIEDNDNVPPYYKLCKKVDEDPFNDCKPVDCDTYYNGKKTHFSKRLKRCVEAPTCISNDESDYPDLVYNPTSNKCVRKSIAQDDINELKNFISNENKDRKAKDIIIIRKFHPNGTDFIDNINVPEVKHTSLKQTTLNAQTKHVTTVEKLKSKCLKALAINYLRNNKWTILVFGCVILVQCFLICSMVYCLSKSCDCWKDKKVVRKFFNYRHDVSVTTPLIGTSNVDTETADCPYLSETSMKKDQTKCYKSCQKGKSDNIKLSMTDSLDILSKCLNRRDWKNNRAKLRTESIHTNENTNPCDIHKSCECSVPQAMKESQKSSDTKVTFEDEKHMYTNNKSKIAPVAHDNNKKGTEKTVMQVDDIEETNRSSEKELKSHSYNCYEADVRHLNLNSMKPNQHEKFKKDTISTEKGAQAYFSNDSMEDFISEQGAIYLANENLSKYTFSADSIAKPSMNSSISSKTSKNFLRNVLSLLHKRSKQGSSSDPGKTKMDVKLLHMSRQSVYSSSNELDCAKNLNRTASRTSF